MSKIKMRKILSRSNMEYEITRTKQTMVNGFPVNDVSKFYTNMTVTNTNKTEQKSLEMGNTEVGLLKVRILYDELYMIEKEDTFMFDGEEYKITRKKPYQENFSDFLIFYAGLVV